MRAEEYFATEWPAEVPRLRRMLARNGISIDALDDVLQEAALRLYSAWGRVFDDRPLRPLVNTIVLNVARDHHRRAHYEVRTVAEIPDAFAVEPMGTEQIALARVELARAGRALLALTQQQREVVVKAVVDELAGEQNGRARAPAATRMAITRARRRLVDVLEVTAAAVGVCGALVRRGANARGARPAVAVGLLTLSAAVLFGGSRGVAPDRGPASTGATTANPTGVGPRAGVSQWQYQSSNPALDRAAFADRYAGTSRWTWDTSPWLWVGAGGAQVRVGEDGYDDSCTVRLADHVDVRYRCLPSIPPAAQSTKR